MHHAQAFGLSSSDDGHVSVEQIFAVACGLYGLSIALFPRFMLPFLVAWANLGRAIFSFGRAPTMDQSPEARELWVTPVRVVGVVLFVGCCVTVVTS